MSYRIDYRRKAYQYQDSYGDRALVVITEAGDNNMYEIGSQRRSRHWSVLFHGSAYSVYQDIADYCGRVAGGTLHLKGHRRVGDYAKDITAAIRLYDRTIKSAMPLVELFKEHSLRVEVKVFPGTADDYAKQKLDAYLAKYGLALEGERYDGQSVQTASIPITTADHLLDTLPGSRGWGDEKIRLRVVVQ